jgi:hypothetical protein
MFFRAFAVIAFVPVNETVDAFEHINEHYATECRKYATFVSYFESTYIGVKKRGRGVGRHEPLFKHAAWNVNKRTINGQPRTSNNMEGWHNAITYSVLGLKQHHILKLIDGCCIW